MKNINVELETIYLHPLIKKVSFTFFSFYYILILVNSLFCGINDFLIQIFLHKFTKSLQIDLSDLNALYKLFN